MKRPASAAEPCRPGGRGGLTLLELLAASLVMALLAGGILMAFMTSAKMSTQAASFAQGAYLGQQTLERFRNEIACDNTAAAPGRAGLPGKTQWFDGTCASVADFAQTLPTTPDNTTRDVTVAAAECDGDATKADCFRVTATIEWFPPD